MHKQYRKRIKESSKQAKQVSWGDIRNKMKKSSRVNKNFYYNIAKNISKEKNSKKIVYYIDWKNEKEIMNHWRKKNLVRLLWHVKKIFEIKEWNTIRFFYYNFIKINLVNLTKYLDISNKLKLNGEIIYE